ncbi:MAG: hypothetical protein ABW189_08175 [Rickettsiales bacterium]
MSVKYTAALAVAAVSLAFSSARAEEPSHSASPHEATQQQPATGEAAPAANEASSVKQLPKKGMAAISGSVDDVDSPTEFTLRDAEGNTINVKSDTRLSFKKGDRVRVQGLVEAGTMGIGEKITSATVAKIN